jgi:hypothetical protein
MKIFLGTIISLALLLIIQFNTAPATEAQGWTNGREMVSNKNTGLPDTDSKEVILNILKWLLRLVFMLTIFAFIGSGIMFIMSFSNSGIVGMAKDWLMYAVIGLVVSVLGFVIILAISEALTGR